MPSCADYLAESLRNLGIRRVFGLPGGENVHVVDALDRQGLEFILVRNESSAAYAAAACWRLTGQPQACLTTLGPGATHAAAGLGHLWLDRAAAVFITARTAENAGPMHTHQVLDLTALMGTMAKSSFVVRPETAHQIPYVCSLMQEGRPGPVHVQISNETAGLPMRPPPASAAPPCPRPTRAELDPQALADGRKLLAALDKPIIVAGLGLHAAGAAHATVKLAEKLDAPVLVTPYAKGVISDAHPLAAGVIGLTRTDPAYATLAQADGVIALGFDVVELVKPWDWTRPLIWGAAWANRDPRLPADIEMVGDMECVAAALARDATPVTGWRSEKDAGWPQLAARANRGRVPSGSVSPQQALHALRAAAADDAVVTVDVGAHKIYFSLAWPTYLPSGFLLSNGLSCMGFGLAGAIGAGLCDPQRQVFCVIGDGGLAMCAGELGLLREIGSNTKVIVLRDQALDLIRSAQGKAGKPAVGTEFGTVTDHVKLAQAYGIPGLHAGSAASLEQALATACGTPSPFLIEVQLDPTAYPTFSAAAQALGKA